jgi:hypothetical protein
MLSEFAESWPCHWQQSRTSNQNDGHLEASWLSRCKWWILGVSDGRLVGKPLDE